MKKNKWIPVICGIAAFLLAVTGIVGYYLVNQNLSREVFLEKLSAADKSVAEEDFEAAIIAYTEAIAAAPEKPEGYRQLAATYIKMGDYNNAKRVLSQGYKLTKEVEFKTMISTLMDEYKLEEAIGTEAITDNDNNEIPTQGTIRSDKQELIATEYFEDIQNFKHRDYLSKYGEIDTTTVSGEDILQVTYQNFPATCYYQNTGDRQPAFNVSSNAVHDQAVPDKIIFEDLGVIFPDFGEGITKADIGQITGRIPAVEQSRDGAVIEFHYGKSTIILACNADGEITDINARNEVFPNGVSAGDGEFSGYIIDAVTGYGVAGAAVSYESENGTVVQGTTGAEGRYELAIAPGTYRVTVIAEGYIDEEFTVTVGDLNDDQVGTLVISPLLSGDEIRVVLEWGAAPSDLDSHLTCYSASQQKTVSFMEMQIDLPGVKASLDVDALSGYGPETITVQADDNIRMSYRVNNYSHTGSFAQSGATVKVYQQGQEPLTFTPPSGAGYDWDVFEIINGEIKEIGVCY